MDNSGAVTGASVGVVAGVDRLGGDGRGTKTGGGMCCCAAKGVHVCCIGRGCWMACREFSLAVLGGLEKNSGAVTVASGGGQVGDGRGTKTGGGMGC